MGRRRASITRTGARKVAREYIQRGNEDYAARALRAALPSPAPTKARAVGTWVSFIALGLAEVAFVNPHTFEPLTEDEAARLVKSLIGADAFDVAHGLDIRYNRARDLMHEVAVTRDGNTVTMRRKEVNK